MKSQAFTAEAQSTQRAAEKENFEVNLPLRFFLCVLCASAVNGARIEPLTHEAAR
jgi:hypothetical protein